MPRIVEFPPLILIDQREKLPYSFADIDVDVSDGGGVYAVKTLISHVVTGDYTIDGLANSVAIERKSLADLYGTLGGGRERFQRELERLNEMEFALVIVESEWSELLANPPRHSRISPKYVHRSVMSYRNRFPRVQWDFVPGRRFAEKTTFQMLRKFWEYKQRNSDESGSDDCGLQDGGKAPQTN